MRILAVDDEFVSRMKLKTLLGEYGEVDAVPDGGVALRMAQCAYEEGAPYGLITADINMPGMDGHELVGQLRKWEEAHHELVRGKQAKILMITSTNDPKAVMSSFREGAEWYLVKPVTPQNLRTAIEKIELETGQVPPAENAPPPASAPRDNHFALSLPDPASVDFSDVDMEFWAEYESSTSAKVEDLEAAAMELEACNDVEAASESIMRILHSLKGEAGMIGLTDVQEVCHGAETLMKEHEASHEAADLVLSVSDWIQAAIRNVPTTGTA
jgi:CheY-like chemotaxis protein/HPt (histidine-containing phosphotransfer) domain-containing protein